jgi:hypothetical protein
VNAPLSPRERRVQGYGMLWGLLGGVVGMLIVLAIYEAVR